MIGASDLTGGPRVASPQTLALVRATVVAVENHLALLRLTGPKSDDTAPGAARLVVLGADRPRWQVTDEHRQLRSTTLTGRHADILVLLSRHPEGLSADHLAVLLDDKDLVVVTVRAEMSRLRRVIGPLQVSELELPTPGYGEALVKLETSGVCHTDLHAAHGDWPVKPQPPFVPGHEGYGTVVALGEGVDDLKVGDKVGNAWLWSACGHCEYCRTGWETLCESQQNGGYSVNGSFGSFMLVNAAYAPRIPDNVDPLEIAPILCAGVTVYKGLKVTDTRPGQWVAISGIGGLGHIAVQYARAMGLRVVAVDVDDSKLALATRLGAEVAVNAATSDVVAEVQKATGGVHGVLVTAVHPQAFGQAIGLARRGGTIVFNGLPPGDFPAPIFDIVLKGLTIRGSIVGTRQDMAEALDFYARGMVHPLVASAGLDEINDVFRPNGTGSDRRPHRHRLPKGLTSRG